MICEIRRQHDSVGAPQSEDDGHPTILWWSRDRGRAARPASRLTNLDQPLGPDAGATKRDLVDYLDAVADRILPGLAATGR